MKICTRCNEEKPLAQFGRDKNSKDGFNKYCHPCAREVKRKIVPETQICTICQQEQPSGCFPKRIRHPVRCLACIEKANKEYDAAYRKDHTEDMAEYMRKVRAKEKAEREASSLTCANCNETKPWAEFPKKKVIPLHCNVCRKKLKAEYNKKYREENAEQLNEYIKQWRTDNPDYKPNPETVARARANAREKYNTDPEYRKKVLDRQKAYYATEEGKKSRNESWKSWRQNNLEKARAYAAEYYGKWRKTEEGKRYHAEYKRMNRYATRTGAEGNPVLLTNDGFARLHKWQRNRCYVCNVSIEKYSTVEHIVPGKRGGSDGPRNIVLSCKSCNFSRQARLWGVEWSPKQVHDLPDSHYVLGTDSDGTLILSTFAFSTRNPHAAKHFPQHDNWRYDGMTKAESRIPHYVLADKVITISDFPLSELEFVDASMGMTDLLRANGVFSLLTGEKN